MSNKYKYPFGIDFVVEQDLVPLGIVKIPNPKGFNINCPFCEQRGLKPDKHHKYAIDRYKNAAYNFERIGFSIKLNGKEEEMEMAGAIRTSENNTGLRCKNREICAVMTGLYSAFVTSVPAFAAGESQSIISGITQGTEQIWRILIGVVAPIAAAALALQVIKIIWGGQRAAEEAKSAAIKIVIAIAVVLMAPAIVSAVRGWFTQASWNFGG